jgi:hypothetical protein
MEAIEAVPVYVLATDGRLYRDPVIVGVSLIGGKEAVWAIVFDATEPPQVLIEHVSGARVNFDLAERAACSSLREAGVAAIVRGASKQVRLLDGDVRTCFVFDVEVLRPIPARNFDPDDGHHQPRGEHVLYAFGRTWG